MMKEPGMPAQVPPQENVEAHRGQRLTTTAAIAELGQYARVVVFDSVRGSYQIATIVFSPITERVVNLDLVYEEPNNEVHSYLSLGGKDFDRPLTETEEVYKYKP